MGNTIYVRDHDTPLQITYQDMLKYHGHSFMAGVAMAFKLLELVSAKLARGEIIRDKISVLLGVNGPGIIDGIELATRAKSRGALAVDQRIARDKAALDAADGKGGRYYFEIRYGGVKMTIVLKNGLIPSEFLSLARKTHDGTITTLEIARLQQLKAEIAEFIMAQRSEDLFDYRMEE